MEHIVHLFGHLVVQPAVGWLERRLNTGPIGATARLYACLSALRLASVIAAAYACAELGWIPTVWLHDHAWVFCAVTAATLYAYVVAPALLTDGLLCVSRGEQTRVGTLAALHARGTARGDLSVAFHLAVFVWSLLSAALNVVLGDVIGTILQLGVACLFAADAFDGIAMRHPRVAGLVVSSLDR